MAIVRLGAIVGGISGTLAGAVWVVGRRSTVVRKTPVTRLKSSRFLARTRSTMAVLRKFWSTFDALEQDAWTTAAALIQSTNRLGLSSHMSGFEYFIMTNRVRFPGTFNIIPIPTDLRPRDIPVNPAVAFSASGDFTASVDNPSAPSGLRIQVYGWPFWTNRPTRSFPRLVFIAETAAPTDPIVINVRPEWIDHFGDMVEGQRFACGIKARIGNNPFNPMPIIQASVIA